MTFLVQYIVSLCYCVFFVLLCSRAALATNHALTTLLSLVCSLQLAILAQPYKNTNLLQPTVFININHLISVLNFMLGVGLLVMMI